MQQRRLVQGLTVAFGGMSLALVVVGVLTNPLLLVVAAFFLVVTGLLWYQASGRLAQRLYRRVEHQARVGGAGPRRNGAEAGRGGFGAGPREDWTGPHRRAGRGGSAGAGIGPQGGGRGQQQRRQGGQRGQRQWGNQRQSRTATGTTGLTAHEAADVLGVEVGADEETVRTAYREQIKEVHPDAAGGDRESFRRVRSAYERLSE